jgi:phosphatidate phosphatase APP1
MGRKRVLKTLFEELRARILQKELTVYDSYGYRDPVDQGMWLVPMRVWVHDNRDTPFVEDAIENWAIGHFEKDLERPLETDEKAQLRSCLANFIADDKSNEPVRFTFANDANGTNFEFKERTTHNGVIAESVRVPDELVRECYARQADENRWLEIVAQSGDHGIGKGRIRFLAPEGLSVVSDIDDTIRITHVPAGKRAVLRNTFLKEFRAAEGMRERYLTFVTEAGASADTCFHYVSGSPWQLYGPLKRFLFEQEQFPAGTVHMKNLRKNLLDRGAIRDIMAFALGGDLATLDQKIRQITNLMIHLPRRKFILVGDSGEKDPEVYRAIRKLFPHQVLEIYIRDVLGERLAGMELITGSDVSVSLDTGELELEMESLIAKARADAPESPSL